MVKNIYVIIFLCLSSLLFSNSFGYLRIVEASICMDFACSEYLLEDENGGSVFVSNANNLDLSYYLDRFVEITSFDDMQCMMCSAIIIDSISISDNCNYPFNCIVDPCEVAEECALNTPVDCVSNYCGGCYADFYDLNDSLVDCYVSDSCTDLYEVDFGLCDMFMGFAYVNGQCQGVSGCGWEVDGIDYSSDFFNTISECELTCEDDDILSCSEIEIQYNQLHSGDYTTCVSDSDCNAIWGDCGVGLGGCHYSVNNLYNEESSDLLVEQWIDNNCESGVCDCFDLPNAICNQGTCDLTYCEEPNPAGCWSTGCNEGYDCVDFGNTNYDGFCVPSTCFCDENYFGTSSWICTEDCNGGTCIAEEPQPGELCVYDYNFSGLHWPGIVDCNGECLSYEYYNWLGDGWCDDGWGLSFNCDALDFDNGDCENSCNSGDVNNDASLDILDIVLMVECILNSDNTCNCSDLNQDNELNVLDIIMAVGFILD